MKFLRPHEGKARGKQYWKSTKIGLLNAHGIQNNIIDLKLLLQSAAYLPSKCWLDILAITESWSRGEDLDDYSTVSKYSWLGKHSTEEKGRRGVGFWIHNRIRHAVTQVYPEHANPNIMWIQYTTIKGTFYFSVTYVPYNRNNHQESPRNQEIFATLAKNTAEFKKAGIPIHTGDLNAFHPLAITPSDTQKNQKFGFSFKLYWAVTHRLRSSGVYVLTACCCTYHGADAY